jgi:hypothetical protein
MGDTPRNQINEVNQNIDHVYHLKLILGIPIPKMLVAVVILLYIYELII